MAKAPSWLGAIDIGPLQPPPVTVIGLPPFSLKWNAFPDIPFAADLQISMVPGPVAFGLAAAFSFYPTKVVTCGEGGMILTASDELADEAMIYRDQGKGSFGGFRFAEEVVKWLYVPLCRAHCAQIQTRFRKIV